ncbi:MAG: glycoside hydrolase family 43 protein [Marinilabiliales bacterium]|nr:glycoside hydrolase family 43 protein [Marinilabiliales bacterium]
MKKWLILTLFIGYSWLAGSQTIPGTASNPPVSGVLLGDPFILNWEGKYYAYGTSSPDGIVVYESEDLKSWRVPAGARNGLALDKADVWGERWFWAPEVYAVNGRFYLYFSAEEHICVATADSPLGPFRQEVQKPMISDEKCIDNSLFIDDDGTPYLFFVRFNDGNNIWVARLERNLTEIVPGSLRPCIHVSQPWEEVWPRVNEGPYVFKRNGRYLMTYSANSYESPFYGIGVAEADRIEGPWTKCATNPIYQKPGSLVGIGHSAMFRDNDGKLRMVFHAHNHPGKIHPRRMYISTVVFDRINGEEVMKVDPNYGVPEMKP